MAVAMMKKRPGAGEKTKGLPYMVIMTKEMPMNMVIMTKEMSADMIIMKKEMPAGTIIMIKEMMPEKMVVVAAEKTGARTRR